MVTFGGIYLLDLQFVLFLIFSGTSHLPHATEVCEETKTYDNRLRPVFYCQIKHL